MKSFFKGFIFATVLGLMAFRPLNFKSVLTANNTKTAGVFSISIDADVNDTTVTINYGNERIAGYAFVAWKITDASYTSPDSITRIYWETRMFRPCKSIQGSASNCAGAYVGPWIRIDTTLIIDTTDNGEYININIQDELRGILDPFAEINSGTELELVIKFE